MSEDGRAELRGRLGPGLAAVDALLVETVASDRPLLADASRFLIDAGGKRFRPMISLAAGMLGDENSPGLVACAAAIELMHLATLYHDDVMDETVLRRGVPTAHRRFGTARAILVGDYLFAKASALAADLGPYVSRRLANTIAELVDGQVLETELSVIADRDDYGIPLRPPTVDEHLEVLRLKTATLIATSAHLGAWMAGCDEDVVAAATEFGESTGLAFQIADDLLDIAGDAEELGKEPGTDLREGVLTLPAIATLAGEVPGKEELRGYLAEGRVDEALSLLRSNGSLDVARGHLRAYRDRAADALDRLPDGDGKAVLASLAGAAAERNA